MNQIVTNLCQTDTTADLGCDKIPDVPRVADCAIKSQKLFTKPQHRPIESSAEASAATCVPGRPTNQRRAATAGLAMWPMGRGLGEETKGWAGRERKLPGKPN